MTASRSDTDVVRDLLDRAGRTFAEEARITLKDTPKPLFQLLVLSMLLSSRISADIATRAARELFAAGWRTPDTMEAAPRAEVIAALQRGRYTRYDESTATRLRKMAHRVTAEYRWRSARARAAKRSRRGRGRTAAGGVRRHRPGGRRDLPPRGSGHVDVAPAASRRPRPRRCRGAASAAGPRGTRRVGRDAGDGTARRSARPGDHRLATPGRALGIGRTMTVPNPKRAARHRNSGDVPPDIGRPASA
ncbi:Uncharacterised protein [Prescottella equi]|nr:Uncharacterised protein [Prescottella equi]SUE18929.1 Uncharacterised protein [Prescottella equi]